MSKEYTGGCRCGAVRYRLRGEPFKAGLCHCTDCRRETVRPSSIMPLAPGADHGEPATPAAQ
jgi:hypothetical protein